MDDPVRRSDVNSKSDVTKWALSLANWATRLAEVSGIRMFSFARTMLAHGKQKVCITNCPCLSLGFAENESFAREAYENTPGLTGEEKRRRRPNH